MTLPLATFSATLNGQNLLLTLKLDDETLRRADDHAFFAYMDAIKAGRRTWNQTVLSAAKQLRREGLTSDLLKVFEATADIQQE